MFYMVNMQYTWCNLILARMGYELSCFNPFPFLNYLEKSKPLPVKLAQNQKVQYGIYRSTKMIIYVVHAMPGFATPSRRLRFGLPSRQLRHWIHGVEPVHLLGHGHCSHLARAIGDDDEYDIYIYT